MGSHPTGILEILEPPDGDIGRILEQLLFNICGRTSYKPSIGLRRKCKKDNFPKILFDTNDDVITANSVLMTIKNTVR